MKRIARLLTITALACFACAPVGLARARADNPDSHRQSVLELFDVLEMKSVLENAVTLSLDAQMQTNPALGPFQDVVRSFLDTYMGYDSLRDDLAALYMETFTEKELRQIVAFYRTPVGRKTVASMPVLMARGAELGQERLKAHLDELQQMIARRIQELSREGGAAPPDEGAGPPDSDAVEDGAPGPEEPR